MTRAAALHSFWPVFDRAGSFGLETGNSLRNIN